MKKLFQGWKIEISKLFEINKVYHKKLMRIKTSYQYLPKPVFSFICSKLADYHNLLEKEGVDLVDETCFFAKSFLWEWNTMNSSLIQTKIHDLFEKIGIRADL